MEKFLSLKSATVLLGEDGLFLRELYVSVPIIRKGCSNHIFGLCLVFLAEFVA